MARRGRSLQIFLAILALFLLGTVVVLSSISVYLSIDSAAYLTEEEVGPVESDVARNASLEGKVERIPRILHQTWKTETLPDRWIDISRECREMMSDYEYILWTDAKSREFIAEEYPWFLDTFDAYTYPIQRADAIRYFILYHYGGVYLDLDVGCRRRLDRLLVYPVILPKTIPVGVSNDLMFAEKGHPFMAQTIHNLVTFDHSWVLNYPTVMFSTGPMFLSAQYGIWTSSHPPTLDMPGGEVRILPKSLYGKNAKPEEVPHAFFSHYYGSSWHADDAAFIGFLGKWGSGLMRVGFVLLIVGVVFLIWRRKSKRGEGSGRTGRLEVLLPRAYQRNGKWHFDFGLFTLIGRGSTTSSPASSAVDDDSVPMLPMSFDVRPPSPSNTESSFGEPHLQGQRRTGILGALSRAGSRAVATVTGSGDRDRPRGRSPNRRHKYLFFLPAVFTPSAAVDPELSPRRASPAPSSTARNPSLGFPLEKGICEDELEDASVYGASSSLQSPPDYFSQRTSRPPTPGSSGAVSSHAPPPYPSAGGVANPAARSKIWNTDGSWEEWESR